MTNPIIRIHNVETDEVIDREMTNAEYEVYLADKEQETKKIADSQKALADKEAARQAVYAKLGLTADEIAALV
jgi:hypothetical protein